MLLMKNVDKKYLIYPHQVAGHRFEDGKDGILMDSKDGNILKPIQDPPRGERELQFYEHVFSEDADTVSKQLRCFVPSFHGVEIIPHPGTFKSIRYLKLEDVTRPFRKPCIMDVKIGKVIVDHLASKDKMERYTLKYPEQALFGFRILGMKIYDKNTGQFCCYNKSFGKQLKTQEQIRKALLQYFCPAQQGTMHILKILKECKAIKNWFLKQRKFNMFGSSILVVYEGATNDCQETSSCDPGSPHRCFDKSKSTCGECSIVSDEGAMNYNTTSQCDERELVRDDFVSNKTQSNVHLVDFAHTYIKNFSDMDENYLYGLGNFINYLEELVS